MLTLKPKDKRGCSLIFLLIVTLFYIGTAAFVLGISLTIYFSPFPDPVGLYCAVPFSLLLAWVSTCFLSAIFNAYFSETTVVFADKHVTITNTFLKKKFSLPYEKIKSILVTDLLSKSLCWEIFIVTHDSKLCRIAAFSRLTPAIHTFKECWDVRLQEYRNNPSSPQSSNQG